MRAAIQPLASGGPASRRAKLLAGTLLALLAGLLLCATAPAADSILAPSGSPCSGSSTRAGCAGVAAAGEGEEGEQAAEEGEGEEDASSEARAEEAGSKGDPPSSHSSSPSRHSGTSGSTGSAVVLSRLRLTARAAAALRHAHRPYTSAVGFSFTLSAPAKVQVTLVKQTVHGGHTHWAALPTDSLTLSGGQGRVEGSLAGHNRLSPGRYRLTLEPQVGSSRSIYLSARP